MVISVHKLQAHEMIENIRSEFVNILNETDWLDQESRRLALDKANNLDIKVGYPEFLFNDTHLNEIYEKVNKYPEKKYSHSLFCFYFSLNLV
jgi:membrane metallo-endopeptidase-like protein 1